MCAIFGLQGYLQELILQHTFQNNFKKGLERDAQVRIALALDMRASR